MSRKDQILELLQDSPEDSFLHFALAKEYENEGKPIQAQQAYQWILDHTPDYVGAYYHLAHLYWDQLQDKPAARQTIEAGILVAQRINDPHAASELKSALMNLNLED
ncbi:MAG TPA: tetratricopeptide repeat protein [Saprospiraceae bacterium]|nr:tetratricopeptide repeat protein [Saprospiraceae bacterium]